MKGIPPRRCARPCRGAAALLALWVLGGFPSGCADAGPSGAARLDVIPGMTLAVGVGDTVRFSVTAVRLDGSGYVPTSVRWTSTDPGVATVSGAGLATAVAAGTTTITARAEGATGDAGLEVWVPEEVGEYRPGTAYLGRRSYVEYVPGTLPVVLSAPHGGSLTPSEIPDRSWGTLVTDVNTVETVRAVREAFLQGTGSAPHVVISHLRRTKLDPNRDIAEAAQGSPFAELAWSEFHRFIEIAEAAVGADHGAGLYLDIHGHGHDIPRVELGYLLLAADLNRPDAELDDPAFAARSSIRALAHGSSAPFSAILRGDVSLGGYLAVEGVPSVPSPDDPTPGSDPYYSGGYNTRRHGSMDEARVVSGVQLELHRVGIRDTEENRRAFARSLAAAVGLFLAAHPGPTPTTGEHLPGRVLPTPGG